jgi:hypothetical protein
LLVAGKVASDKLEGLQNDMHQHHLNAPPTVQHAILEVCL